MHVIVYRNSYSILTKSYQNVHYYDRVNVYECINRRKAPLNALDIKILFFTKYFTEKGTSTFDRSCCLRCERTVCGNQNG